MTIVDYTHEAAIVLVCVCIAILATLVLIQATLDPAWPNPRYTPRHAADGQSTMQFWAQRIDAFAKDREDNEDRRILAQAEREMETERIPLSLRPATWPEATRELAAVAT